MRVGGAQHMATAKVSFIAFILLAVLLSGTVIGVIAAQQYWQWQASRYTVTTGKVLNSFKTTHKGSRLRRPMFDLRYEYVIDGRRYESQTLRYDQSPQFWDELLIAQYPVGREVTVFTNPENPQDAVLEAGVDWGKVQTQVLLWFILPAIAIAIAGRILDAQTKPPIFLRPTKIGNTVTVRTMSPRVAIIRAAIILACTAVGGAIFIAMTWSREPWMALLAWFGVTAIPLDVYFSLRRAWKDGRFDLTINFDAGTLTLPGSLLIERDELKIEDVRRIYMLPEITNRSEPMCPVVVAKYEWPLKSIGSNPDSKTFAVWLAEQLNVPLDLNRPRASKA